MLCVEQKARRQLSRAMSHKIIAAIYYKIFFFSFFSTKEDIFYLGVREKHFGKLPQSYFGRRIAAIK